MKLVMQVGLGPGHIVLDGDPALPPPNGYIPQFSAHICCGQMAGGIKMPLGMEVSLGPGDFVLDGDPAAPPPPKGGRAPNFRPMSNGTKRLGGSRWHLAWRWALGLGPGDFMLDGDPSPLPKRGQSPSNFRPISIVTKRLDA